eukprot:4506629-Pleurochrysis_carterae.AAC.2
MLAKILQARSNTIKVRRQILSSLTWSLCSRSARSLRARSSSGARRSPAEEHHRAGQGVLPLRPRLHACCRPCHR